MLRGRKGWWTERGLEQRQHLLAERQDLHVEQLKAAWAEPSTWTLALQGGWPGPAGSSRAPRHDASPAVPLPHPHLHPHPLYPLMQQRMSTAPATSHQAQVPRCLGSPCQAARYPSLQLACTPALGERPRSPGMLPRGETA
ncbi:hypothetical protein QTO34_002601 [Cnephaeus nilssonii]|uniref:Uncharacterized protein n=1 Tax=Cnephaeus nilssonii TaxID=3371016 RepID=A0AA40LM74_CNENI|nr:hypothetical protein QTO34_002601 [Eptesicus nilssonii]